MVDELDEHMVSFDALCREVAGDMILRLKEILGRSGVEIIWNDAIFDRVQRKPDTDYGAAEDGTVVCVRGALKVYS
jgi:hypothetical protein